MTPIGVERRAERHAGSRAVRVRPLLSLGRVLMEREAWIGPRVAPIHIGVCVVRRALSDPLARAVDRFPFQ